MRLALTQADVSGDGILQAWVAVETSDAAVLLGRFLRLWMLGLSHCPITDQKRFEGVIWPLPWVRASL